MSRVKPKNEEKTTQDRKKPYQTPLLEEWGSILDLTQGPLNPPADGLAGGGSSPT